MTTNLDLTATVEMETLRQHHRMNKGIRATLRRILRHIIKLRRPKRSVAPPVSPLRADSSAHEWDSCDHMFYYFRIVDNYYYQLVTGKVKFIVFFLSPARRFKFNSHFKNGVVFTFTDMQLSGKNKGLIAFSLIHEVSNLNQAGFITIERVTIDMFNLVEWNKDIDSVQ